MDTNRDMGAINERVIRQFRDGGEIEGMHRERLLLLTTTGRTSGEDHTTPMMFHREPERLLVVAANMGATADPHWYLNLVAHPHVLVEVGDAVFRATAVPLVGEDRDRTWRMLKESYSFFAEYDENVDREIPVVALIER